jgi:hypothetical protein
MIPRRTDPTPSTPAEPEAPLQFTEQVVLDLDFIFSETHVLSVSLQEGRDTLVETPELFTITFAPPGPYVVRRLVYVRKAQLRATQQLTRIVRVPQQPYAPTP